MAEETLTILSDTTASGAISNNIFCRRFAADETGATSIKQMGVVMKAAQGKLAGKRADGKTFSEKVRSKLQ